jgi:hypothetical protein
MMSDGKLNSLSIIMDVLRVVYFRWTVINLFPGFLGSCISALIALGSCSRVDEQGRPSASSVDSSEFKEGWAPSRKRIVHFVVE